jgi:hypothetical protein
MPSLSAIFWGNPFSNKFTLKDSPRNHNECDFQWSVQCRINSKEIFYYILSHVQQNYQDWLHVSGCKEKAYNKYNKHDKLMVGRL